MSQRAMNLLQRYNIIAQDIQYIIREEGNTVIYTANKEPISTYISFKEFEEDLPEELFIHPNKGVLIAVDQITEIKDGAYETKSGRVFKYRKNNSALHDRRLMKVAYSIEHTHSLQTKEGLHMFDNIPLPVCAVKMDFDEDNIQADFTFTYCNQALSDLEGIPLDHIIGRSIKDFILHLDMKWYIDFADVALNNTVKTIEAVDVMSKNKIRVLFFQPEKGYCACMITEVIKD